MAAELAPRAQVVSAILAFLSDEDHSARQGIQAALDAEIERAGPGAMNEMLQRLVMDAGWGYYPPDPLARRMHHVLADRFVADSSHVAGTEWLRMVGHDTPLVICSNHLSYADANVIEVLLMRSGYGALAGRLTAIAGPKVFSSRQRRFSSLCFGTVKVPQSADVSSGDAVLAARDVARAARSSLEAARSRLASGDALLLFGEGTRSRSGEMGSMLTGAARYLDLADAWILPVGLAGSEALFPIDAPTVHQAHITLHVGAPLRAHTLLSASAGNRRLAVDAIGLAIAELLPLRFRGAYSEPKQYERAHQLLLDVRPAAGGTAPRPTPA